MTTNQTLASNANHNYYANEITRGRAYYGAKNGSRNTNAVCVVLHTETSRDKYMVTYVEFTPNKAIYDEKGYVMCHVMTAKEYRKSAQCIGDIDLMECNALIYDTHGIYGGFLLTDEYKKNKEMFFNGVLVVDAETYEKYMDVKAIKDAGIVIVPENLIRDDKEMSAEIETLNNRESEYNNAISKEEKKISTAIAEGNPKAVEESINKINGFRIRNYIVHEYKTNLIGVYLAKNKKENRTIKF